MQNLEREWNPRDPEFRRKVIADYTRAVEAIAYGIFKRLPPEATIELEDLVASGLLGLVRAVNRFNPTRGVKFGSYAGRLIHCEMMEWMRSRDCCSRKVRSYARAIHSARTKILAEQGRTPNDEEVAAIVGLSMAKYHRILVESDPDILTIVDDYSDPEGGVMISQLLDDFSNPLEIVEQKETLALVREAIQGLRPKYQDFLSLYYCEEPLTLSQIGELWGLTESRVCQIHQETLRALRSKLRLLLMD